MVINRNGIVMLTYSITFSNKSCCYRALYISNCDDRELKTMKFMY